MEVVVWGWKLQRRRSSFDSGWAVGSGSEMVSRWEVQWWTRKQMALKLGIRQSVLRYRDHQSSDYLLSNLLFDHLLSNLSRPSVI